MIIDEKENLRRMRISKTMIEKGLKPPILKNHKWTEEQNRKRSLKLKGHKYNGDFFKNAQEYNKKFGHPSLGKHLNEDTKDKISKKKTIHGKNNYSKKAIKFYGLKCNECGMEDERVLLVHHKDKNRLNNNIENLEVLCWNCHIIKHNKFRRKSDGS
jgi:hypothetical protein